MEEDGYVVIGIDPAAPNGDFSVEVVRVGDVVVSVKETRPAPYLIVDNTKN